MVLTLSIERIRFKALVRLTARLQDEPVTVRHAQQGSSSKVRAICQGRPSQKMQTSTFEDVNSFLAIHTRLVAVGWCWQSISLLKHSAASGTMRRSCGRSNSRLDNEAQPLELFSSSTISLQVSILVFGKWYSGQHIPICFLSIRSTCSHVH